MKKTIILTGGGTGGHVIPHLSILPKLLEDFDVHYIGTDGIEKEIMKDKPITYHTIKAVKFDRSNLLKNFSIPFKLFSSIKACKKLIKKIKPDIIFSKGGYVSLPVVIAGKRCKTKIISHESDQSIGLANKIIYKYSNIFCTSFESTAKNLKKAVVTGSPIRENIKYGNKSAGYKLTNLTPDRKTILFMGGSTGAKAINDCVAKTIDQLTQKYNVIHIVGKGKKINIAAKNYYQLEYVQNIEDIFAITDFIVSRAGSNAIFEFLYLQKPTLLIPLPKGASRGDQVDNAKEFCDKNLMNMLMQEDLTPKRLLAEIEKLEKDAPALINNMAKIKTSNGSQNILNQIYKLVKKS